MDKEPLKVLLLTEVTEHASTHLRGLDPLKVLEGMGLVKFGVHTLHEILNDDKAKTDPDSEKSDLRKFSRDLAVADVLVIPQTSALGWTKFLDYWKSLGKTIIFDIDDDVRYVHPLSQTYATRGTTEVTMTVQTPEGKKRLWLWKDGTGDFDIAKNKKWQEEFLEGLSKADAVTCPTRRFADTIAREINPRSFALPNCVDTLMWKPGKHPGWPKDEFRICWHGGDAHRQDVGAAAAGVGAFLRKHPDAVFVLVGAPLAEWRAEVPQEQLEWWDWAHYEAHPWRLMSLGVDVGLAPVANHKFNDAKSPLKWEEFSACGVPVIASNCPPYSDAIRDGEDGWLVTDTAQDWEEALDRAYNEVESRKMLGARARARIVDDFDLSKKAIEWYEVWSRVVAEKKATQVITEVA